MSEPSATPPSATPRRDAMRILVKIFKWVFYLGLCIFFVGVLGISWPFEIGWYLAFGWIHFILRNLATVELNGVLFAEGIACMVALGIGTHYFCRWLYREAESATERAWRWHWTASGLAVVMMLFVAGIGTIGAVHQAAWLFSTKGPLLVDSFASRAPAYEALLYGSGGRTAVQAFYESTGRLPRNGDEAGYSRDVAPANKFVSAVEIREQGVVVVILNRTPDWPDGGEFTLTPGTTEAGASKTLTWKCRSTLPPKLLPGNCRE